MQMSGSRFEYVNLHPKMIVICVCFRSACANTGGKNSEWTNCILWLFGCCLYIPAAQKNSNSNLIQRIFSHKSENENVELIHGFLRFVIVAKLMNTNSLPREDLFIIKQMSMAIVVELKTIVLTCMGVCVVSLFSHPLFACNHTHSFSLGTIALRIADSHGSHGTLCKYILLIPFHISFDFICAFALKTLVAEASHYYQFLVRVYRFRKHVIAAQRIIFVHFKWFANNNGTTNYQHILGKRKKILQQQQQTGTHAHAWIYMVNMGINSELFMWWKPNV